MTPAPLRRGGPYPFALSNGLLLLLAMLFSACGFAASSPSLATDGKVRFAIPAGLATDTLRVFAAQGEASVRLLYAADVVAGVPTSAVHGYFTAQGALEAMLKDSPLSATRDPQTGAFVITRATATIASTRKATPNATSPSRSSPAIKRRNPIAVLGALLGFVVGSSQTATGAEDNAAQHAQQNSGSITGRVLNVTNGNYLNNARVTVEGTTLEAFTNEFGEYRLVNVTPGAVTLRANFTGLTSRTASITVAPGQRATQDFDLSRGDIAAQTGQGDAVVLDAFVIASTKEMSGREMALNEQRFAANLKNVVSSDEFGDMAEGNVGEFLKFIPGVTIDYVGADARNISVRGLPSLATPVMVDGAPMASAASSSASRIFELEQVSINNVSRVEVTKSPTPDLPASAVGGAINMVSRSAFERARPLFNYRGYLNWNTDEGFFEKTNAGPGRDSSVHTNPSFDFSYLRPVNKNFGFTLTGSYSDQYAPDYRAQPNWLPGFVGSALAPTHNPFLRNYTNFYGPKVTQRTSVGTTLDWRISHGNVLTFGAQWNYYDAFFHNKTANINTLGTISNVAPAAWGPTFTQSQPGAASVALGGGSRRKSGTTGHMSLKFVHDGPVWKIDAGATYSDASNHYRDADKGFSNGHTFTLSNLTMRLDNIDPKTGVPASVTTTSATGAPIDWTRLAQYRINNINFAQINSRDLVTSARVNAKRDFALPFLGAPVGVKTGIDLRRMDRDIRSKDRLQYTFVGPDRSSAATSTDDFAGLYDLVNTGFYKDGKSGFGEPWLEYPSSYKLYDLFTAHPEYFSEDAVFRITNETNDSKKLTESISAAYFRTDWRFSTTGSGSSPACAMNGPTTKATGLETTPARYINATAAEI
jgi:iron complex outermembrane recepter protein